MITDAIPLQSQMQNELSNPSTTSTMSAFARKPMWQKLQRDPKCLAIHLFHCVGNTFVTTCLCLVSIYL